MSFGDWKLTHVKFNCSSFRYSKYFKPLEKNLESSIDFKGTWIIKIIWRISFFMRIWLAYKFRGANLTDLKTQLEEIAALLQASGHQVITMLCDIQNWNPDSMPKIEAVRKAYALYGTCDLALCIYSFNDPSEGRGWDAGYFAGMGKPTIMAVHNSVSIPYTEALFLENPANKKNNIPAIIRYADFSEIADALKKL